MENEQLPWNLALVDAQRPLAPDFQPALGNIQTGQFLDLRIVDAVDEMFLAAREEGLDLEVISAFRSYETQTRIFEESMIADHGDGANWTQAFQNTSSQIAVPGTSEHQLGLALDIVSPNNRDLANFNYQAPEAIWLRENSWRFGLVLRFPEGATGITGFIFEPWHYRYVGMEAAQVIFEQNITLEEFLLQNFPIEVQ